MCKCKQKCKKIDSTEFAITRNTDEAEKLIHTNQLKFRRNTQKAGKLQLRSSKNLFLKTFTKYK